MSFGIAELALQGVIQDGLNNLRNNPHHLEFILGKYVDNAYIAKRVGANFVKNAMEMLLKNDLTIRPYFTDDIDTYPCLVMAASYSEDQKYLGDYGDFLSLDDQGLNKDFKVPPTVYAKFDATSISKDVMTVDAAFKLPDSIFPGVFIMNGKASARVRSIQISKKGTLLYLDAALPAGTPMKGWQAQTLPKSMKAIINGSHNAVTVQISLFTSGSSELHRVYAQVIRYCLKRGRAQLEELGLQDSSFSQQPPIMANAEGPIFQSTFNVDCLEIDTWIAQDYTPLDRIEFQVREVSDDPDKAPV